MSKAFVVRPFPHGINRLKDFLSNDRVAIGWPCMGTLEQCKSRDSIKAILKENYGYSSRKLGNAGGQVHRFCNELKIGDYVLVPNGGQVFIGKVKSDYKFDPDKDSDSEGWSHYRDVEWLFEKQAVEKSLLDGRVVASLKGQSTFFESWGDSVEEFISKNPQYRPEQLNNLDLIDNYLTKLESGTAKGINAHTFEDMVCEILQIQFPTLVRLGTRNSKTGDTDLKADCIGGITIRIQVKYYDPKRGLIQPNVIDQLADSMEAGDNGLIVSSGTYSEEAIDYTNEIENQQGKSISLVTGRELVELLFENLDKFSGDQLRKWGVISL